MERAPHIKQVLSVFFAFVLAVTLVPSAALATDGTGASTSTEEETTSDTAGNESTTSTDSAGAATDSTDASTGSEYSGTTTEGTSSTTTSESDDATASETDSVSLLSASALTTSDTNSDEDISLAATSDANPDTSGWTVATTEDQLKAAVDSATDDSYIKLGGSITLANELDMAGGDGTDTSPGAQLHLDLNGYSISRTLASENSSSYNGSVIYMNRDAKIWIYDTSDAQTGSITGGYQWNSGGGIHANQGNRIYLYSGSISGNKAYAGTGAYGGGGVYLGSGCKMYMEGGSVSNNTVDRRYGGGGIFCDTDSEFYLTAGTISGNKANGNGSNGLIDYTAGGGGVYLYENATFSMSGGKITGNSAAMYGGGMIVRNGAKATITGGEISNNTLTGFQRDSGKVYGVGGGIFIYGSSSVLNISNATISGNSAPDEASCGGIYQAAGTVTITNSKITSNSSAYNSGGIHCYGGTATIIGCEISNNTAANDAGGILMTENTTIQDTTISNNKASANGGGIKTYGGTLTNTSITGNTASGYGGGMYIPADYSCTIESATITGNTSGSSGSGVYGLGACTIKNITVTGNTCSSSTTKPAGAFCVAYPVFNVVSDSVITINGNTGGDYVRNTDSGDTSDNTCAKFNGYTGSESVNVALTLSPGETYQKLINMGNTSQSSWFSVSNSSSYYMAVESDYWVWVFNSYQTGNGIAIEGATVSNSDGTVVATATEGTFDNGGSWAIDGTFANPASLNVEITYVVTSYSSTTGKGTATKHTDTLSAQDFSSGSKAFTYTTSSGSNTATATANISIASYDSSLGIFSWGGALRLDSAATTDSSGNATYATDTANLRHGYCFNLPSGANVDSFGWNYGTTSGSYSHTLVGTNSRAAGTLSTDKSSTGTVANIVFTNVPIAHYGDTIYSQMYVTYTASDGSSVTLKGAEVGKSVNDVVSSILATGSTASDTEKAYANALQDAQTT